jgi:hypothetical protein
MRSRGVVTGALAALVLAGTLTGCEVDPVRSTVVRPADPVVVRGADVARLTGVPAGRVVGFRASSDGWTQIPVQVDERLDTTMADVYDLPADTFGNSSIGIPVNVYADPGTFVGADPDPDLDADDEIAFMARDAGGSAVEAGLGAPGGTVPGTGVEVRLDEPDAAGRGYVYLFHGDGSLDPGAGRSYVSYDFDLASGDYLTTYSRRSGPNPEDSTITGASYTAHFADRWLMDRVTLSFGDRPGVDLVDRMKYRLVPGVCGRSEDTFNAGEGAFVVNRVGPVRALRGYVGANSGPNTQATHAFYDLRFDTSIDLRVHAIPGVAAYLDLSREAVGMTFRDPQVPGGVAVDGQPDAVPAAAPSWWTLDGPQGGLGTALTLDTDLSVGPQSRYDDDLTPTTTQCTGDGEAVGEAGAVFGALACTDPGLLPGSPNCTHHFRTTTATVAAPAGAGDGALVRAWTDDARSPLEVTTATFG